MIVKLIDFGLAATTPALGLHKSNVGTLWYIAPEIHEKALYTSNADVWSLGCLLYEMIYGKPPFTLLYNISEVYQKIKSGEIKFSKLKPVSEVCKEFIMLCLQYDPKKRLEWR